MADRSARRPAWVVATLAALPVALVAGLLAFWWLGGFRGSPAPAPTASSGPGATGPVQMDTPSLADPTATACRALIAKLPDTDGDLPRRPVTAGAEQNAAYGEPPVTLACGVPALPAPAPTATVLQLSGVCWYADHRADATVWTTLDRTVPVRVRVPLAYDPPSERVIVFSGPIAATLEPDARRPSGC